MASYVDQFVDKLRGFSGDQWDFEKELMFNLRCLRSTRYLHSIGRKLEETFPGHKKLIWNCIDTRTIEILNAYGSSENKKPQTTVMRRKRGKNNSKDKPK